MCGSLSRRWYSALTTTLTLVALTLPVMISGGVAASPSEKRIPAPSKTTPPEGDRERGKKKEEAGDSSGKKGEEAKEEKDQPKAPPFEKAVKGARVVKGLFTVYVKEDEAKYLLEIAPDQMDVTFLVNPTLVSGVGQGFLYPADMWSEYPVAFHRVGKTVQLIHKNPLFRAGDSSSLKKPAEVAAPEAIVAQAKIESLPHPDRKSILVDLSSLFLNDLEGMSLALKSAFDSPYGHDKDGSSFAFVKGFPQNLDFETVLHFKAPEVKNRPIYAADPRSLLIRFHYSISKLPNTGYRPRLADDRVGHFVTLIDDYSDDRSDQPTVRYITSWHLEKKDPSVSLSEPKQPIVYYLENSIPKEYRDAVRRGVLGWNPAFEAIGFKNAIVVRDQPDDPDWDPADIRYATLRWIVAPGAAFAQGPSRVDPYTGEIFDADIRFSADLIRFIRREFGELVTPATLPARPGGDSSGSAALRSSLSGWTSMLGPFSLEELLGGEPTDAGVSRAVAPKASLGYCDYSQGLLEQAALGWSVLATRGLLTPEAKEKYVADAIMHNTLHEVGHTLGLRHNFKASSILPFGRLQDAAVTSREGLTGSVMDYIPVNLASEGKPQGEYWQTEIGPYDRWAIEYAYKPITADSPEAERPELERIASRCADPRLAYGTDEDTFAGTPRGIDPMSSMWDLGDDTFAFYQNRAAIARELFTKMEDRFSEPGTRYQKLRLVFAMGMGEMAQAVMNIPKYVGGIRHNRDHIGDPNGRLPYEPVPAAQQRQALAFLTREVFGPEAFRFSPRLLNKLAVERFPDLEGAIWSAERNDLPIHSLVLAIQSVPMNRLYSRISLGRLNDLEARYGAGDEAFTMAEMFSSVRKAVWSELQTKSNVNSFRRNLQRRHLQTLIDLVVNLDGAFPEDARTLARADLTEIRRGIDADMGTAPRLDTITRAHLDESRARATAALAAGLQRQIAR